MLRAVLEARAVDKRDSSGDALQLVELTNEAKLLLQPLSQRIVALKLIGKLGRHARI